MRVFPSTTRATWLTTCCALLLSASLVLAGCTDLSLDPKDSITPDNFFRTEAEFLAAITPVYAQLRNYQWGYHEITQISTDETIIPVRGTDWDDGGKWLRLHQHEWTAQEDYVAGAWGDAYTGIARANTVLDALENTEVQLESAAQFEAELRTLRAFFYVMLMDLFGNVPIVEAAEVDADNPPASSPRADVFAFVEQELLAAIENLPEEAPQNGRVNKSVAHAILASIYLNAEVYTGTVTESGLQRGTAMYDKAIEHADAVLNSGLYDLSENYFANFALDSHTSPEMVFFIGYDPAPGQGWSWPMRTLHYNLISPSPWNGWATLAETYNAFDDEDVRKDMFLVGPQRSSPNTGCYGNNCFSEGDFVTNRQGQTLTFDLQVPLTGASEGAGARVLKWELDPEQIGGETGNDLAVFRLAEMYLIKAEAHWHLEGPNQTSADMINVVRDRAGLDPIEADDVTADQILKERLNEFMNELKRRQDLIRFDRFVEGTWMHKDVSDPYRVLMPIPQSQLEANRNLEQNPGY